MKKSIGFILSLLVMSSPAFAGGYDAQLLRLAPGVNNVLTVESGDVNKHLQINTDLVLNYSYLPLSVYVGDENKGSVIKHRLDYDFVGAIGLFNFLDIGWSMSLASQGGFEGVNFSQDPLIEINKPDSFSIKDLRITPKIRIMQTDLFSFALVPSFSLPTGDRESFTGDRGVTFSPAAATSMRIGKVLLASNMGYTVRKKMTLYNLEINDELFYRTAAMINIGNERPTSPFVEAHGRTSASNPFETTKKKTSSASPLEVDFGVKGHITEQLRFLAGFGVGLQSGYNAPTCRVFLGVGLNFEETKEEKHGDCDGDGFIDPLDYCPCEPEDFDDFLDLDGCPELDNDLDTIIDTEDSCPLIPEDFDNFKDDDGCPDPDNDIDKVLDENDECPMTPADRRHLVGVNGCAIDPRNIEFEFDSDVLKGDFGEPLRQVFYFLTTKDNIQVRIEGHTDNVGSSEYNMDLSQRRADAVKARLVNYGIDENKIITVGFGEDRPISSNLTERGRQTNRRIEFFIINLEE